MRGRLLDLSAGLNRKQRISVEIDEDFAPEYGRLNGSDVSVEIKKYRDRRSLGANSMCWSLCHQIGIALSPPLPKEEVYRNAIRSVGVYEPLPIKDSAVEQFCYRWQANGVGWFADVIGNSKIPGYKLVFAYYGSSTYNSKEMSVLIDCLVEDARQMGIETLSERELSLLKDEWGN